MYQFKKTLLVFFFLGKALVMPAQTASIDSLRFIIRFNNDNVKKINAYKALANALIFKDFDACQETAIAGAALAEKIKDDASLSELKNTWAFPGILKVFMIVQRSIIINRSKLQKRSKTFQ
ncbi:MAG: hypothetical protein IPN43_18450 [Chitinophagaceae bacterium]|nr:hypothetical protein [Chitinophagaceae bacterium]